MVCVCVCVCVDVSVRVYFELVCVPLCLGCCVSAQLRGCFFLQSGLKTPLVVKLHTIPGFLLGGGVPGHGLTPREPCTAPLPEAECIELGHEPRDPGQIHWPSQRAHSPATAQPSPGQKPREPCTSTHTCFGRKKDFFLQFLQTPMVIDCSSLCLYDLTFPSSSRTIIQ